MVREASGRRGHLSWDWTVRRMGGGHLQERDQQVPKPEVDRSLAVLEAGRPVLGREEGGVDWQEALGRGQGRACAGFGGL